MRPLDSETTLPDAELAAARRRAGIVAAVAGLGLVPYFYLAGALAAMPVDEAPPVGAPAERFVDFHIDNFSEMPLNATLAIGMWVIWLFLIVALVRAACRRLDLAAILAVTLAGSATAVFVVAEGILVWPVVLLDMTASRIRDNLDLGVAEAMVLSRDGIHATAIVLLGCSMFVVAWLLARSDPWGHWAPEVRVRRACARRRCLALKPLPRQGKPSD
ncbi:MAG: hypothetical protein FJW88_09840 [Actinobacteria bacterium]|nr:hypothetical protein [Actinomycetota bacterium]